MGNKYVSLLRGINVSGHRKIKMADLKFLYEELSCENVITYIQSGNVIFEHISDDPATIKNEIETAIEEKYSFDVYVNVLHAEEFKNILLELPFDNINLEQDGTKFLITFQESNLDSSHVELLSGYVKEPEKVVLKNNALYLHCPNGYGKTKLSNALIENKLKTKATTRNLKTVTKLCQMI